MRSANNRRTRKLGANKACDSCEFIVTKKVSNISIVSDQSEDEAKTASILVKDKLNNLSEKWFEDINDCVNPSVKSIVHGLAEYYVRYML